MKSTNYPRTRESLQIDLQNLGLEPGARVLVHSSLSSMGWINGGEVAIIQALMDTVTDTGTIVMPSQSVILSNPAEWENPPVPRDWWKVIRDTMPAYDPIYTPTTGMGSVVEVFRSFPGVIRSSHPSYSFVAWGKDKEKIIANQSLNFSLGEQSPLAKLYDSDAHILFLGTTYETCTAFHLAEYRVGYKKVMTKGAPLNLNGKRVWKEYQELEFREELFEKLGQDFEAEYPVNIGIVGSAASRLIPLKVAVYFAEKWLNKHDQMLLY